MNKNKIIIFSIVTLIVILLIGLSIAYIIKENKINPIFKTEKITLSYDDYSNLKFKVINLENEKTIKEIIKLSSKIDIEKKVDYNLAIKNDYKIDFNNGNIIWMQNNEKHACLVTNDFEKVIIVPDTLIKLVKESL